MASTALRSDLSFSALPDMASRKSFFVRRSIKPIKFQNAPQ